MNEATIRATVENAAIEAGYIAGTEEFHEFVTDFLVSWVEAAEERLSAHQMEVMATVDPTNPKGPVHH